MFLPITFLLLLKATHSTTTHNNLLRGPIVCSGCLNSVEPWGDVLGDNPIARKSEHETQIGDGGGDSTLKLSTLIPGTSSTLNVQHTSTTPTPLNPLDNKFEPASGDVLPGPTPTIPHEKAVTQSKEIQQNVEKTLQHGATDTLDNKCFYCDECPEKFGQKCYMLENNYELQYQDGVCLGLSFLWVHAKGWDGFIETLASIDGRKVIQDIMDGQEKYMKKTHFPPNYAKGLMTEMYNIPAGEIDVEMVELGHENPRLTFEHFIQRAITGPDADGKGNGPIGNCIVIVFSKAHAMALRVTSSSDGNDGQARYHFFDPNYGQFGMATIEEFVERLWHFVQPPNVQEETALPAYGDVWAYVRHADISSGGSGGGGASTTLKQQEPILKSNTELGPIGNEESEKELPFVPTDAAVLPMSVADADINVV